jgi:predicted GNAT family acetyltransferase
MPITVHEHAADLLAAAEEHLLRNEVANALLVGVPRRVAEGSEYSGDPPFFAVIRAALRENDYSVPGVNAPRQEAEAFATEWKEVTGQRSEVGMNLRSYELRTVIPPDRPAAGRMRPASPEDLDLLVTWSAAFLDEVIPDEPRTDDRSVVRNRIEAGDLFVWVDDGEVVSMVAKSRPAGRGITINYVYTPSELRARGYATTCVAAVSRHCLDDLDYAYCTLFTDLDNPTTNDIYMRIGYRPVCDFRLIRFRA